MREQLAALAKLSEIDESAREYDAELKDLPARIDDMRNDVRRLEELLAQQRQQLEEAQGLKKQQEQQIAHRNETISRSKAKGAKARTPKEADAAEREVEANRRAIKEREDEILRLEEAVEKVRSQVEAHEKDLEELRQHFAEEEKQANARLEELQSKRAEVLHGRDEVAEQIPKQLLRRYERVRGARGSGVAMLTSETCSACSMALPPQLFIEIQRGETIEQCPNCLRLLVYKPLVEG